MADPSAMSKKRTSAESNNDELTNKDSDLVFRQEDIVKRAKLTSWSDTTLQDLPIELLECILIKVVAMEVKGMKLAKSVWREKADLVISRLRTVCSQWSNIFTTNFFRNELYRTLDGTAQETIRLEILQQSPIQLLLVSEVTTMKDEIFMLCDRYDQDCIVVYDRNNTTYVKDVIVLPGIRPMEIAGCSVSNCVYVLNVESHCFSVLRITKVAEHQFNISPWISDLKLPTCSISVSSNGNLVILSRELLSLELLSRQLLSVRLPPRQPPSGQHRPSPAIVRIHNANGFLQHEMILSPDIFSIRNPFSVIQNTNGNLVLASIPDPGKLLITEIDTTGRILRQYQSAVWGYSLGLSILEMHGRILISDWYGKMELLDSELNSLDFTGQKLTDEGQLLYSSKLHYNSERNEIALICDLRAAQTKVLTTFRFTEQ